MKDLNKKINQRRLAGLGKLEPNLELLIRLINQGPMNFKNNISKYHGD